MGVVTTNVFNREVGGAVIESAHTGASSSLALLRAVDGTVDGLMALERKARGDGGQLSLMLNAIRNRNTDGVLDPDGILEISMLKTGVACEKICKLLRSKQEHAESALNGDFREAVCDGYESAISAVSELKSVVDDLAVEIKEHDLEFSAFEGPFDTVEELLADLR